MPEHRKTDHQMTNHELQKWVEQISLESFGIPFHHQACFNSRFRAVGGRYALGTHQIEISRLHFETFGPEETEQIIKHELCHYHLHIRGLGYRHKDTDFKQLLHKVGGSKYCRALPDRPQQPYRYKLICRNCGVNYMRKRRVNTKKYVCGKCRGKLQLISLDSPLES